MNTFVVYQIKNKIDNKIYVGSTNNISKRWHTHRKKLSINKHHSPYLQNAWNKYGEECFLFEIIQSFSTKKDMLLSEQVWLDTTCCYNRENGYNVCKIAGSPLGHKHSNEAKLKISNRMKGENHPFYGKKLTIEHKERISKSNLGKIAWNKNVPATQEERIRLKQIRSTQIIGPRTEETKNKISEKLMGHDVSEKTKEKLKIANLGKRFSEETKKKLSQIQKEKKRLTAKLTIEQVMLIKEMLEKKEHSQDEIANMFRVSQSTISAIKHNKIWS
jgi:group I intron endonuclease